MRLSVVTFMRPGTEARSRPLGRIVDYARQIEKRGFPGIWVTDSIGRGRPTLDPLVVLGALSVATQRIELGTAGKGLAKQFDYGVNRLGAGTVVGRRMAKSD